MNQEIFSFSRLQGTYKTDADAKRARDRYAKKLEAQGYHVRLWTWRRSSVRPYPTYIIDVLA